MSMTKENLIEMLEEHSAGMKGLSLSLAIITEEGTYTLYYNGEHFTEEVPGIIYEIGSVTKTFTASLLAKLLSQGKIALDDTIDRYFPEIVWSKNIPIPTILQLVTHTSGIGNDIDCSTAEAGAELEKRLAGFSGDFENECIYGYLERKDYIETLRTIDWENVSHEFRYSNIGMTVLGIVLEKIMGVPYESMMSQFIKEDLGLQNTWLDAPKDVPNGYIIATPYGLDQTKKSHWIWNHKIGMAAGGIYSTLEDMIAYVKAFLNNTPKYLKNTYTKQLAYSEANHFSIAVSWIKEGDIVWHNGATGCFHSFVGFHEKKKMAVVLLENHHELNDLSVDGIGKKILDFNL